MPRNTYKSSDLLLSETNYKKKELRDLNQPSGFTNVISAAYWTRINKWENDYINEHTVLRRGEWIDDFLSRLLSICKNEGFSVKTEDEQELRDELFDYIKSVSY